MPSPWAQTVPISGAPLSNRPEEVLDLIISYLEGTNLKRLRLVSWQLHRLVTPALFARLTVDCYHFGLHDLSEVAATAHLAPLVKEVVFEINDLSIRSLVKRLRHIHSISTSKCHTNLLRKLKNRPKVLGTFKPCYDLISAPQENHCMESLPRLMSAFQAFSGLRSIRIVDNLNEIKPPIRGFCFTILGMGIPVLHLKDHRLSRLPSYDFQGIFSGIVLLALQLSDRQLDRFDGYCPVTRDLVVSRAVIASTYPELLAQVDIGEIHFPTTITEATLRINPNSFFNLDPALVSGDPIPITKAFHRIFSRTNNVEVLRIEVLDAPHRTLEVEVFFSEWLKDNSKALPRLRVLELTKAGLHQDVFEKFLIRRRKSLKELRLHSVRLLTNYDSGGVLSSWPRFIIFLRTRLSLERVCLDGEMHCEMHRWFAFPRAQLQGYQLCHITQLQCLFELQKIGGHRYLSLESIRAKERRVCGNGQDLSGRIHRYILGAGDTSDNPLPAVATQYQRQPNGREIEVCPIEWRGDWSWLSSHYPEPRNPFVKHRIGDDTRCI